MHIVRFKEHMQYSTARPSRFQCVDTPELYAFMLNFAPGQGVGRHQHGHSRLTVQVLTGEMSISVDEEPGQLATGEVVVVEGQQFFSMKNEGQAPASVYITLSPNPTSRK